MQKKEGGGNNKNNNSGDIAPLFSETIEYLVLCGGAIRALAHSAAIAAFEKESGIECLGKQLRGAAGTSMGSIMACLVLAGYSGKEMMELCLNIEFSKLVCTDTLSVESLIKDWGLNDGKLIETFIGLALAKKEIPVDATFEEFCLLTNGKDLRVVATELDTSTSLIFSKDTTPKMRVVDALIMSSTLPLFMIRRKTEGGKHIVDGGFLRNFPFDEFGSPSTTLGFYLASYEQEQEPNENTHHEIEHLWEYIHATFMCALHFVERAQVEDMKKNSGIYKHHIVRVNANDMSLYDFKMSVEHRKDNLEKVYDCMRKKMQPMILSAKFFIQKLANSLK